jgi:hypothetical protein
MKTIEVLDEMFLLYVRSEEYASFTEEGRNEFVDAYETLKQLASSND